MSRLECPFDYTYPPLVSKRAGAFMICPCPFSALSLPVYWESLSNIDRAGWKHVFFFTIQLMWTAYRYLPVTYFFLFFRCSITIFMCYITYIFIFLSLSNQFVNKLILTKYFLSINTTDKRTFKKINLILRSRKIKRENILN
jgi:hypothetical protein